MTQEKRAARMCRYYEEHREEFIARARCWAQENPEKRIAIGRRYRKKHLEKERARCRRYIQEHREEHLARNRRWRKQNPDYYRRYREKNREERRASHTRRRARKRAAANTLTPEQLEFERRIGEATYPGEKLHLHHLVPLGKGNHSWGNVVFIPASLNASIQDKLPEEVYAQLTYL